MQDFSLYVTRELEKLSQRRKLFVEKYPKLLPFLSPRSDDPDVEYIVENLALLTAEIRREMDKNIPIIAQSILQSIAPNYLAPFPSVCIQEFALSPSNNSNKAFIPRGTEVVGKLDKNIECKFYTTYDVELYPIHIENVFYSTTNGKPSFEITILCNKKDVSINALDITRLNFYLGDNIHASPIMLMWFSYYLEYISISPLNTKEEFKISAESLNVLGFSDKETLLNDMQSNTNPFELIKEFCIMPEKFHFVQLNNLGILKNFNSEGFCIKFVFKEEIPQIGFLNKDELSLFASPAVNLFKMATQPILHDFKKDFYRIVIDNTAPDFYEIVQILNVQASSAYGDKRILKNYGHFYQFNFFDKQNDFFKDYYSITRTNISTKRTQYDISFFSQYSPTIENEVISILTLCCNGDLPHLFKREEINQVKNMSHIVTRNITKPSEMFVPADNILWQLVLIMSLNYTSLLSEQGIKLLYEIYDLVPSVTHNSFYARFSKALKKVSSKSIYRIVGGISHKGTLCNILLDNEMFNNIGEIYRFGLVASFVFSWLAPINSFCEVEISLLHDKRKFSFFPQVGNKPEI